MRSLSVLQWSLGHIQRPLWNCYHKSELTWGTQGVQLLGGFWIRWMAHGGSTRVLWWASRDARACHSGIPTLHDFGVSVGGLLVHVLGGEPTPELALGADLRNSTIKQNNFARCAWPSGAKRHKTAQNGTKRQNTTKKRHESAKISKNWQKSAHPKMHKSAFGFAPFRLVILL